MTTTIRKGVMKKAWEIYRELEGGDRIARLSVALKKAWAEAKAQVSEPVMSFRDFWADGHHYWCDSDDCYRKDQGYEWGYAYRKAYKALMAEGKVPEMASKEMALHPERLSSPQCHTVKMEYTDKDGKLISKEMLISSQCIQQLGEDITRNILRGTSLWGGDTGNIIKKLEICRTYPYNKVTACVYVYDEENDKIRKKSYDMREGFSEDELAEAVRADGFRQYRYRSVKEWTYIQK